MPEANQAGYSPEAQAQLVKKRVEDYHETWYFALAIAIQFIIVFVIAGVVYHFTPSSFGMRNSLFTGALIWTPILFFTPMMDMFFVRVPDNHGSVITNSFRKYELPDAVDKLTVLQLTRILREVGPGWQGKLPWENPRWTIDLERKIIISRTVTAYSSDGIELTIKYLLIITPLRSFLPYFVRNDDEAIREYFIGKADAFIIVLIKGMECEGVFENLNNLKNKFNEFCGGKDTINPDEEQWGVYTNDPQLFSVTRSQKYQEARETVSIAKIHGEAADALVAAVKSNEGSRDPITPSQALNTVLVGKGVPVNLYDIRIRGLEELRNLNLSGIGGFGGKGNKPKD